MNVQEVSDIVKAKSLRDWDVSLKVLKGFETTFSWENYRIFIKKQYPETGLLCTQWSGRGAHYLMSDGEPADLIFLSMLLNSDVGEAIFRSIFDSKINLRSLKDFPTPLADALQISSGALLESYLFILGRNLEKPNLDAEVRQSLRTLFDFLSLIRNYYVEELYIPDIYRQLNVSVIEGWLSVNKELPQIDTPNGSVDILQNLFSTIAQKGDSLLAAYHKMKVLNAETSSALLERLSHF